MSHRAGHNHPCFLETTTKWGNKMNAEHQIRVMIVDDHALVRLGFRRLLEDDPELIVVGEASDGTPSRWRLEHLRHAPAHNSI